MFGIVYGLVAVLGFILPSPILGLIEVNMADNLLHVVLALVFLYIGFGVSEGSSTPSPVV
ncbi:MAG: DUF4383 domain-containing protein [Candidatus Moraniibacteriota bacterium]